MERPGFMSGFLVLIYNIIMSESIEELRAEFERKDAKRRAKYLKRNAKYEKIWERQAKKDLEHDTKLFIRDLRKMFKKGYGKCFELPDHYADVKRFDTDNRLKNPDIEYIYSKLQEAFSDIDTHKFVVTFYKTIHTEWHQDQLFNPRGKIISPTLRGHEVAFSPQEARTYLISGPQPEKESLYLIP